MLLVHSSFVPVTVLAIEAFRAQNGTRAAVHSEESVLMKVPLGNKPIFTRGADATCDLVIRTHAEVLNT